MHFTGRLWRDKEIVSNRVEGEIELAKSGGHWVSDEPKWEKQWRGHIKIPVASIHLLPDCGPFRLDCDDGFSVLIFRAEIATSSDNEGTVFGFWSQGKPLSYPAGGQSMGESSG